jgi:hypothetical protein
VSSIESKHPTGGLPAPAARRPGPARWWDGRLIIGVLLVLVSMVAGARVVASADDRTTVWSVSHDLPAGTALKAADLEQVKVHLGGTVSRYVGTIGESPVGRVLVRPLGQGELVPAAAVMAAESAPPSRLVTVPVEAFHHPTGLARGERVDVFVTPDAAPGSVAQPELVLRAVTVDSVVEDSGRFGSTGGRGVVLAVSPDDSPAVVGAVQRGAIDLVRIPAGSA